MKNVYIEVYSGLGDRSHILYGAVRDYATGELLVNATLDYVKKVVAERGYMVLLKQSPV